MLGWSIGTLLGGAAFPPKLQRQDRGRIDDLRVSGSAYGVVVPQVFGTFKVAGNIIWARDLVETSTDKKVRAKGGASQKQKVRTYTYTVDCAVAICKGPLTRIVKIWGDDLLIYDADATPTTSVTLTTYLGDTTQLPDVYMESFEGVGNVPGYRGTAYVVFENLELSQWGNRIPNFSFLVERFGQSTAVVEDSFNRANGGLGVAGSGQTWQDPAGATIVSNQCLLGTSLLATWIDSGLTTCAIELYLATRGANANGILVRFVDTLNYWSFRESAGVYKLVKYEAAIPTAAAATTIVPANGDQLKVEIQGNVFRCYVNGTLEITHTDAFNNASTKHGMYGNSVDSLVDNFSLGPLAPNTITLGAVLADLFGQVGLEPAHYDVSAATAIVNGFVIPERNELRLMLEPVLRFYDMDLAEVDGQIVAIERGAAVVVTLDADDLGAHLWSGSEDEPESRHQIEKPDPLELPRRVDVTYWSAIRNYQTASQGATRQTKDIVQQPISVSVPLALTDTEARQFAEKTVYQQWLESNPIQIVVMPKHARLAPGDVVAVPIGASTFRCRVIGVQNALPGPVGLSLVLESAAILTQDATGQDTPATVDTVISTATTTHLWSGNALQNADADGLGLYLSAGPSGDGYWEGAVIYISRDGGTIYEVLESTADTGQFGTADTVLAAGVGTGIWDDINTVEVTMVTGIPETVSDAEVLNGANAALLGDECIQYGTVTALGGDSYELSHLIRGQRGTDARWAEHRTAERFVMLPPQAAAQRLVLPEDLVGTRPHFKTVPFGGALAAATVYRVHVGGWEFWPYAPADVEGSRDGGNNLTVTFKRRDRKALGLTDVDEPMSESAEAYKVDVLTGTTKTITAISSATSGVLTSTAHGYSAGQFIYLTGIVGMWQLNGRVFEIDAVTANTITINADTSVLDAYVSGGTAERVLRTIDVVAETAAYSAANQTTDGLTPGNPVKLGVSQIGRFGRGYIEIETV